MLDGQNVELKSGSGGRRLRLVFVVTLVSVMLSVAIYVGVTFAFGVPLIPFGIIISSLVPCLVAPGVTWVVAWFSDRLRVANYELARVQAKFETQSQKQKDVFRRLSHEMRTPAAAIQMISGAPETFQTSRTQVHDASRTLLSFLDAIQSAITNREDITGLRETFDMVRLRNDVGFLGQALASDGSARFEVQSFWPDGMDHLVVEADYLRLWACIMNLIRNALLHAKARQVTVEMKAERAPGGVQARVTVRDDGVGVAPEKIDQLLRPYERGNSDASGTGLGLAIVQDWLRDLGTKLEVKGSPGEGGAFGFSVFLAEPEAKDAKPATVETKPKPQIDADTRAVAAGLTALLVEDHAITREIAEAVLKRVFGQLYVAQTPREALDMLAKQSVDLLITDYRMPDMTGAELLQKARSDGFEGMAIGLTATRDPEVEAGFAAGQALAVLVKPLRPDQVLGELGPHFSKQNATITPAE